MSGVDWATSAALGTHAFSGGRQLKPVKSGLNTSFPVPSVPHLHFLHGRLTTPTAAEVY